MNFASQDRVARLISLSRILTIALIGVPSFAHAGGVLKVGASVSGGDMERPGVQSSRKMGFVGAHALSGFSIGPITFGAMGQYRIANQFTGGSPDGISLKGKGYTVGPALAFDFGPLAIQAAYDIYGKYTLESGGSISSFEKPKGYTAIVGISIFPLLTFDLLYSFHDYETVNDSTGSRGTGSSPLKDRSYGVGLSLHL